MTRIALAALLLAAPAVAAQQPSGAPAAADVAATVGQVAFANSGAPAAQPAFLRGLALLHNFEYPAAATAFREAQEIDPGFAMAYWGEAMTHTHPIWFQQDLEAAREVLARLGATAEERLAKAGTERERDYLRTIEVLYGEGGKNERDLRFAEAMAALQARYPDDVDAVAFHALAILGTSHEGRDEVLYMRAAALLEEVFPANPRHPGVLHYLIHSYDDPVHAPLGMRAARVYGEVAPEAGHALHMTSHIFVAMGLWDETIDANRRAIAVVNRQRAARSRPPADCGHYSTWLHYGLLQVGKAEEARAKLEACRASAFGEFVAAGPMDTRAGRVHGFVEMRAHELAMGATGAAVHDAVPVPEGDDFTGARLIAAYGDVLAAAQRGDQAALAAATERLRALSEALQPTAETHEMPMGVEPNRHTLAAVMVLEAQALQAIAAGRRDEALRLLAEASEKERSMPFEFGPPIVAKPAPELLADQLLAAGRAAEAEKAYRVAARRTPGRATVVAGLERARVAAEAAGEEEHAAAH